jgi:hypothetical protein
MRTLKLDILAILSIAVMLWAGCAKPDGTSKQNANTKSFTLEIKDSSEKTIAHGELLLPTNISDSVSFNGACTILVSDIPEKPSSQKEYAILCLSHNEGKFSGTSRDGIVSINLNPGVKDGNIYLEGEVNKQLFKGKCIYQSYAGYENFGTFESKADGNNRDR